MNLKDFILGTAIGGGLYYLYKHKINKKQDSAKNTTKIVVSDGNTDNTVDSTSSSVSSGIKNKDYKLDLSEMTIADVENIPDEVLSNIRLEEWSIDTVPASAKQADANSPYTGIVKQIWKENVQLSFQKWSIKQLDFSRVLGEHKATFESSLDNYILRTIS